tara:strand:- start:12869 stop:13534 length:666 start_codon:yes stop_codon:yes gene_type:complete
MKNVIVRKPWGEEYVICKTKKAAAWHLKINSRKKTSLHCHPNKKTGFILLDGKVEVMIGFYEKRILKAPDKLMIRPGLFHSTKGLAKKESVVLEIETPINKNDLIRYKDNYGRENKPYEGKNYMKKLNDEIIFKIPQKFACNVYKYKNLKITIEKIKSLKKLISNRKKSTIFGVLDGGLVDKNKKYVLSAGDIVRTNTVKKLSEAFQINKQITILTCSKSA